MLRSFMSDAVMQQLQSLSSLTQSFMVPCRDKLIRVVLIFKSLHCRRCLHVQP